MNTSTLISPSVTLALSVFALGRIYRGLLVGRILTDAPRESWQLPSCPLQVVVVDNDSNYILRLEK